MRGQAVLQGMQSRIEQAVSLGMERTRRVAHGSIAWSLPRGLKDLRQPQDGALSATVSLLSTMQRHGHAFLEPEDAGITGGTRSLARRLMGLNVTQTPRKTVAPVKRTAASGAF